MPTARRMLFSSRLSSCLGTHSCFTEIQCEYVGGLSHNQCIQTFRCRRQLVFACHGLDSWGWFLMCVGAMSLHVGKLTLLPRWRFFTLRRNSSRRTICGSCTAIITPCSVLHFSDGLYSREPQSFLCLSTTVLDLLVSLKDPRPWKKVRSTSACTTNGSPFSGCRRISLRLVAILARYVWATVPFIICITIYCRSPYLERAREQCLHPITASTMIFQLLPELLYALFSRILACCLVS